VKIKLFAMSIVAIGMLHTCLGCNTNQKREKPVADEQHIQQLILELPLGSQIRAGMEEGARGEGVHYPWMDRMKDLGVQREIVFHAPDGARSAVRASAGDG